jgi:endogenous inhibitor of DNA gyrase (YacG/DUF329 family)
VKPNTTCGVCSVAFYASPGHLRKGWGRYCSIACRSTANRGAANARWKETGESKCSTCGKSFHRKPSHLADTSRPFCSDACRRADYPAKETRTCKACQRTFDVFKSHADRTRVHCSLACARTKPRLLVTLSCLKCGKSFERKRSAVLYKKGAGAFCSMDCKAAWMSGNPLSSSGVNRMTARKGGKRADLNGRYFRSSWEANYARLLNWLLAKGDVTAWEFEPVTFEFPVKRGSRFYTPDFRITYPDGSQQFHEIKGFMDPRSATKLKRMRIHHPGVHVHLIDAPAYRHLADQFGPFIPHWEGSTRGRFS